MSSRVRRQRAVAKSAEPEQIDAELEVTQEEVSNPVSLTEEPISLEADETTEVTSEAPESESTAVDEEDAADEEADDGDEKMNFSSLFSRASPTDDEPVAESSAPSEPIAAPSEPESDTPAKESSSVPVAAPAAESATSSVRRRRVAAVAPEPSEPRVASPATTPKSNVSGGRFAALKGKAATAVPKEEPKATATTSKFSALKGKSSVVRKSVLEQFEETVLEEGPVTVLNRLLPTASSVKELPESDYVKIRDTLCWIAGMSPQSHKSKSVVADDSEYHSVVIRRDAKAGSPTHVMAQGTSPALFIVGDVEHELAPSTPGDFPGFGNEVISEDAFELFTFELNSAMEGYDLAPIIKLIVDLVSNRMC